MNRSLRLVAALGMLALPSLASAQSITGSINASADIATVFSFGAPSPLNFGTVTPGTAAIGVRLHPALAQRRRDLLAARRCHDRPAHRPWRATLQPTYACGVGTTSATITSAFTSCNSIGHQLTLAAPTGTLTEYVIFNGSLAAAQTNIVPGHATRARSASPRRRN